MKCPHCQAQMGQISKGGEPMVRLRGLVLKAESVNAICPKCKGDVPMGQEMRKALVLFLKPAAGGRR